MFYMKIQIGKMKTVTVWVFMLHLTNNFISLSVTTRAMMTATIIVVVDDNNKHINRITARTTVK